MYINKIQCAHPFQQPTTPPSFARKPGPNIPVNVNVASPNLVGPTPPDLLQVLEATLEQTTRQCQDQLQMELWVEVKLLQIVGIMAVQLLVVIAPSNYAKKVVTVKMISFILMI